MQQLAGINEIRVNDPANIPIPSGWEALSTDPEPDPEEDIEIESYGAPMEGWDENHLDIVSIMKTPEMDPFTEEPQEVKYYVRTYISFGDYPESEHFDSYYDAKEKAVNIMNDIKSEWDEDDEYIEEIKVKIPKYYAIFNMSKEYNEPPMYIIAGSKEEMIGQLNSAIEYFKSLGDDPWWNFKYNIRDLEDELGANSNVYIYDDWVLVTDDVNVFNESVDNLGEEPKEYIG
jgi:hypothetical protein